MIVTSGGNRASVKYSETFTGAGNGAAVDLLGVFTRFSIMVEKTGAVLAWSVTLKGSIDGTNFNIDLITHTDILGNLKVMATLSDTPVTHFKLVCNTLTGGTNVIATILGVA